MKVLVEEVKHGPAVEAENEHEDAHAVDDGSSSVELFLPLGVL